MIEIQSLGGAGFSLRSKNSHVLVDPYFGGSPKEGFIRRDDPPVRADDVADGDLLLSTHSHGDHCDLNLVKFLDTNTTCRFLGPESSLQKMIAAGVTGKRTQTVKPGDIVNFHTIEISVYDGADPKEPGAVIYVLKMEGKHIVHNGDSHYANVYAKIGERTPIDLALLNYGKELYMSADDILKAAADLKCRVLIPMHWDLYVAYYLSPEDLVSKKTDSQFAIRILKPGETWHI